jgi:LPS O-antigen subunit length determinant protein (WzzB/FepE family)
MINESINKDDKSLEYEINLHEIFGVIWRDKFLIFIIITIFTISSIFYALSLPSIYRSEALLANAEEQSSLSGPMQGFSAIAGLAGYNYQNNNFSRFDKAQKILSSRKFFSDKIYPAIHLPDLMANPRWNPETNSISYDSGVYDIENNKWITATPTIQQSYNHYINQILNITTNDGYVILSIDHVSPFIAKDWAELMIDLVNDQFRTKDLEKALSSIAYLNNQIAMTNVVEIRQTLSELLKEQIQISMLTEAENDYVFIKLDPPVAPESRKLPNRSLIVILASLLGGMLGIFSSLLRFYFFRKIETHS